MQPEPISKVRTSEFRSTRVQIQGAGAKEYPRYFEVRQRRRCACGGRQDAVGVFEMGSSPNDDAPAGHSGPAGAPHSRESSLANAYSLMAGFRTGLSPL
jgi:hypothetical protein